MCVPAPGEGVDVQCRGGCLDLDDTFFDLQCNKSVHCEHADQHDGKGHQKKLPGKASPFWSHRV